MSEGRENHQRLESLGKTSRESDTFLDIILDNIGEGMAVSQGGLILYANRGMATVTGYSREELGSKAILELLHPDDREKNSQYFRTQAMEEKVSSVCSFRLEAKSDKIKWVRACSSCIEWKRRPVALHVFEDVTKLVAIEAALQKSEERCRTIFEHVPIGIFQSSLDGKVLRINPAGAAIAGFHTPAEMIHNINDVTEDFYLRPEERREVIDEILEKPGWSQFQKRFFFKGKGLIWCNLTMRAVRNEDGTVRHLEGFIEDITAQKNAEESLQRAHQNLEIQLAKRTADLQYRTEHLERVTTALKVRLGRREEEKKQFEETVLLNIGTLVKPYLRRMRESSSIEEVRSYLTFIEARIEQITSPFLTTLSRKFLDLTPTEIQVANLAREGRPTKEIAQVLYLSENTVRFHRQNLRRKLGLKGNEAGLQSYLLYLRD